MELKIKADAKTFIEGLGISDERVNELLDGMRAYLKPLILAGKRLDKLLIYQQCALVSANMEEYTLTATSVDILIDQVVKEVHEEHCPHCKAKSEAEERREERGNRRGPRFEQVAPGVFMISM